MIHVEGQSSAAGSGPRGARIKHRMRSEEVEKKEVNGIKRAAARDMGSALGIETLLFSFSSANSRNHQQGLKVRKINYRGKAVKAPIIISSMPAASL